MLICLDMRTGAGCRAQMVDGTRSCEHCGQNLHFALRLRNPNTFVERYRILQVIGYGGYGAIYKALTPSREQVALKETFDVSSISTFKREFAVLSRLSHVNLPRYLGMFEAGGHGYLVMEYVPGQSLQDVLDSQTELLPESQVLGYAIQLCDVLHYLHSQQLPILHRDVKPANIRLTPEGRIKLVDFGLLKQGGQQTRATIHGLGTLGYAPIEQYAHNQQSTNARSDIYALGATLYHLLSGKEPPSAPVRIAESSNPSLTLRQLPPDMSAHVVNAITHAMNILPKDRFATTQELKQALLGGDIPYRDGLLANWERFNHSSPKTAEAVSPSRTTNGTKTTEDFATEQQENAVALPTSVEQVKSLLKKAFFPDASTDSADATRSESPYVMLPTISLPYFVPAPHKKSLPHLVCQANAALLGLAYLPLGDKFVGLSSKGTFYEWRVSDGKLVETHQLPHLGRVNNFAYSSNGQTLATMSDDDKVRIWNAKTRQLIHTLDMPYSQKMNELRYNPDGKVLIAIIRYKHFIKAWQVSDGEVLYSREEFSRQTNSIAFHPNSVMFATGGGNEFNKIYIRRTVDGKLLGKMAKRSAADCIAWHPNGKLLATANSQKLTIWRVKDGQRLLKIIIHSKPIIDSKPITHLLWHPGGKLLLSASEDQGVCIWASKEPFLQYKLNVHLGNVTGLAIAPNGRTVAVASQDKKVRLWLLPEPYQVKIPTKANRLNELVPTMNLPEIPVLEES